MTNLNERMLPDVRIEPGTVRIPSGRTFDRATVKLYYLQKHCRQNMAFSNMWQALTLWALWRHKTWDESDVIKSAHNVNWISAHWLNNFKLSPEEYDATFLMVSFTFCICILSEFVHILDQWEKMTLTRVITVYQTCTLFTPINGNEDEKSDWCEYCYFSQ